MTEAYDYAVIGAGFFGVRLALLLARCGARVALVEREAEILSRASFANQARVHNGYHYLRSYSTALGSHLNYDRFCAEMSGCIHDQFDHVYAIARQGSYTNAYQFQSFCRELGLPLHRPPQHVKELFDPARVEDVFVVRECVFDALAMRAKLAAALEQQENIAVISRTDCRRIDFDESLLTLQLKERDSIRAHGVFIVTYADLNQLLTASGLQPLAIKAELAEICLIDVPAALQRLAVTVMDGPFFSVMPMPATGHHSLSHVRYTPHLSWDLAARPAAGAIGAHDARQSRFIFMQKDAQRYMPCLAGVSYRASLFEVKAIPKKQELDDGRPILFHRHRDQPACVSVLGSKIDSIFELERAVQALLDAPAQARC